MFTVFLFSGTKEGGVVPSCPEVGLKAYPGLPGTSPKEAIGKAIKHIQGLADSFEETTRPVVIRVNFVKGERRV